MDLNNTIVKRGRGRPKKTYSSIEDIEDDVIYKIWLGIPLTLEETAIAIWMKEGRKTPRPMSKVAMLKIERRALEKLKKGFAKYGIKSLDDVLFPSKLRSPATSKFSQADDIDN